MVVQFELMDMVAPLVADRRLLVVHRRAVRVDGLSGTKVQAVEEDMWTVGSLAELVLVIELTLLVSLMMSFKISISTNSAGLLVRAYTKIPNIFILSTGYLSPNFGRVIC